MLDIIVKYQSKLNCGVIKMKYILALNSLHLQEDIFLWYVGLLNFHLLLGKIVRKKLIEAVKFLPKIAQIFFQVLFYSFGQ